MSRPLLLVALSLAVCTAALPATAQGEEELWPSERIAKDLAAPVDIVFGPDGTIYYAELDTGKIRAIPPGADAPLPDAVAQVPAKRSENGGFLGLALDPDFTSTRAFFVYYCAEKAGAKNGQVCRVSRVDPSGEKAILDDIPFFERHNGGRLLFTGPDTLVVVTGDNELREPAQDPQSLLGKTLRMTREGKPAPDNPTPGSLVFTLGHRNPFGLAYDAENDILWNTENGPQTNDEINILVAGKNYGWPMRVGITGSKTYAEPVLAYEKTIAPTGATVLDGEMYFGAVNDGKVRRVTQGADGKYADSVVWDGSVVLDVEAGPDGRLYIATFNEIHAAAPPGWEPPATTPPATTPATPPATTPGGTPPVPGGEDEPGPEEVDKPARIPAAGALVAALALALAARRGKQA